MFGADMSSYVHFNNKRKDIFITGNGPTDGLDDTTPTSEIEYLINLINFRKHNKNFSLSLQYNGVNSYVFVDGVETIKLKAKDSEIKATPLYLINISKNFSADI